eukprot:COSAG02_NODE_2406_length_8930_cov_10.414676_3_plen_54_part_00
MQKEHCGHNLRMDGDQIGDRQDLARGGAVVDRQTLTGFVYVNGDAGCVSTVTI